MSDLQKRTALLVLVAAAFVENPTVQELHVTPDGNCFFPDNATYAVSHARRTKQEIEVIKREDVAEEIDAIHAKADKAAAEKEKAEKAAEEKAAAEKAAADKAAKEKAAEEKAEAAKAEKEKQAAEKAAKAKEAKDKKEAGTAETSIQNPADTKPEETPTK